MFQVDSIGLLQRIQQLFGSCFYDFLGFTLDLETSTIIDKLSSDASKNP